MIVTNNVGIEPTYKPHPQSINYQVLSTAADDQSANLAPGLLALSHVWSTNDRPTMTTLVPKVFLEELPQGMTIITLIVCTRIELVLSP